jgi:glycosyltransferase involved in cell wall biosynthesis
MNHGRRTSAGLSPRPAPAGRLQSDDVVCCTAGELFGGVEQHVLDLCRFVRGRTGESPLLVLFHDGELAARATAGGIRTAVLKGTHRYDPRLVDRLAAVASAARVLHAHGYKATIACALVKRRIARQRRATSMAAELGLVKTEHGLPEPGRTPGPWLKMRGNLALDLLATRLGVDAVCYVTCDLAHRYRLMHRKLDRRVIPNGIEPLERATFKRPADLEAGAVNLGIVGRVVPVKGIEFAIRALGAWEVPRNVRLNILGSGPSENALRELSAVLGIQDRVRFLGFRSNVYDYLGHLDALLMPSLHEGLPYTLLEGMSLGLPIVASRVGGLAEVLEDGKTAVLVEPEDVQGLSSAVREVVARPEWAATLGRNAAAEQRRAYTLDVMGEAYWQAYEATRAAVDSRYDER